MFVMLERVPAFAIVALIVVVLIDAGARRLRRRTLPLPPGPPGRYITGNVADMPQINEWVQHTEWGRRFGSVVHLRVLTQRIIVLNTVQAAIDLLDKRGHICADRPSFPMLNDMGWTMSGMPYGERWREKRRVFHHHFHLEASKQYRELQARSNALFLRALLEKPDDFMHHIRTLPARNIMSCTYGIDVVDRDDPWVELADAAVETISKAGLPGSNLVDWLPFFKHIPAWSPGASFKRNAISWRRYPASMREAPFEYVKKTMARGADTTVSATMSFFLSMVLSPEKQQAAQKEIDTVLGHDRLPEPQDRQSLPYVEAVLLEVLRLYPVIPMNIPRRVMEEDEYNGMRIPKGATVFTNFWGILRDENLYNDPDEFEPERYISPDGRLDFSRAPDPRTIMFGFGRRICPGRHFADDSMWLTVATVLACFNISPAKDDGGKYFVPDGAMRSGLVSWVFHLLLVKSLTREDDTRRPEPFMCAITPRSPAARHMVMQMAEQL
ncbi:PAH-inducible cytochrome P450 monooxygenase PC-PAH 3 [Auricularia subglabra TFB-10046 SS5]|nr:PAH-inducible cytochrome P450 monooxygenase PC-PAH 3 [Auricularia subglabra TFB-10046 SS5]